MKLKQGNIIQRVRLERGLTQKELGQECKLSAPTIAKAEQGGAVTLRTLIRIYKCLHLDININTILR